MLTIQVSIVIFFCVSVAWALPKRPISNSDSSGAGEIPDELPPDYRPFDPSLGKGFPNNYDLDLEGGKPVFPEYDENDIDSYDRPHGGPSGRPLKPDDSIPEEDHPVEEPKEDPEEEDVHEPPQEVPKEDDSEEDKTDTLDGEEEKPHEEDTHGVEGEEKPHGDEEETQEAGDDAPLPFNTALFSFQQVNHYIKQLEKAMEHVFKESLEEASLLNNTFANTTEEEVEVDGHKYKVHKSIIKTGDEDKNSTLLIEAISSVSEDEPKKKRKERSNPDSEPVQ